MEKKTIEERGIKECLRKTKHMITGGEDNSKMETVRWPYGCCGREVG